MLTLIRGSIGAPWRAAPLLLHRVRTDSLLRNSVYMMGTTVVNSLLGYIYWILAAHTYPVHEVGLAAALLSAMTLASALSSLGIGSSLIQILPRCAPGRAWWLAFHAGLISGVLTGLVAGAVSIVALPLISPQFSIVCHDPSYIVTLVLGVSIWSFNSVLDSTFIAERAAGNMLVRSATFMVLKNVLMVAFLLAAPLSALSIFGSSVLASALSGLVGFMLVVRLRHHYRPVLRGIAGQIPAMFSSSMRHHFINLGAVAPMYLLPLIITAQLSAADNAYFYTTWMIGSIFFMVSPAVSASLFAEGSHAAQDLRRKVLSSIMFIGVLLAPAMLIFLFAGKYVMAVFGANYAQHGIWLLMILIISAVPDAITNVYVAVLRVWKKLHQAALLNVGMAVMALVLAWLLLRPLGIAGAGWAWLSAQTAGALVVGIQVVAGRGRATRLAATPR